MVCHEIIFNVLRLKKRKNAVLANVNSTAAEQLCSTRAVRSNSSPRWSFYSLMSKHNSSWKYAPKKKNFCTQLPQTNEKTPQLHSKSSLISTLWRKSVLRRESERNAQNQFSALGELSADATALLLKKTITREISIRRSLDFPLEIDFQTVGPVIRLKRETFCWKTTQNSWQRGFCPVFSLPPSTSAIDK